MLFLASLAAVVALSSAAPTADTLAVCDYLYANYPKFLAYDTLGPDALKTAANASQYSVSLNRDQQ